MELLELERTLVIVANTINPSVLNNDWLLRKEIVKDEWGWELAVPPISVPPFSQIRYNSGVIITLETNKITVVVDRQKFSGPMLMILTIAKMLFAEFSPSQVLAEGNNSRFFFETDSPDFIYNKYLKESLEFKDEGRNSSSIVLVFEKDGVKKVISIKEAEINTPTSDDPNLVKRGILIEANFHRDCRDSESIINAVDSYESDVDSLNNIMKRLGFN